MKKKYDRKVLHEILIQVDPLPSYDSIKLDIVWIESPKKRDPDGIFAGSKFICDSLVKSGIIKNDTRDEIKSISNRIEISDNRKVIINIIGSQKPLSTIKFNYLLQTKEMSKMRDKETVKKIYVTKWKAKLEELNELTRLIHVLGD